MSDSPCCVISIDVGICNLAYCIIEVSGNKRKKVVLSWKKLNLRACAEDEDEDEAAAAPPIWKCGVCRKKAAYGTECRRSVFCERHAAEEEKRSSFFVLPKGWVRSAKWLAKKSKVELQRMENCLSACGERGERGERGEEKKEKKSGLVESILASSSRFGLEKLAARSAKRKGGGGGGGGATDFVRIGRNLARLLDAHVTAFLPKITHVVIENQISTVSTKMKTVQGMVMQYFIMRGGGAVAAAKIEFVSSMNKLKALKSDEEKKGEGGQRSASASYRANKKNGVLFCARIIAAGAGVEFDDERDAELKGVVAAFKQQQQDEDEDEDEDEEEGDGKQLRKKKKKKKATTATTAKLDDFADSFLQGWWYCNERI